MYNTLQYASKYANTWHTIHFQYTLQKKSMHAFSVYVLFIRVPPSVMRPSQLTRTQRSIEK